MVETRAAERRDGPVRSNPPQLRQGGGWWKVRRPTGTEDGQGRGGCEQSSTETEVQSSHGCGVLRVDEDTAGVRPEALAHPRPQERVQQHAVEHIVDFVRFAPMVQILDAPVPQMVEQLPDIMHFFDTLTLVPEQVIEVPEILPDDVPTRTAVRDTQLAEQMFIHGPPKRSENGHFSRHIVFFFNFPRFTDVYPTLGSYSTRPKRHFLPEVLFLRSKSCVGTRYY